MMATPARIWRAAPHIRQGDLSPIDILEECLAQIARCDDHVHAWVLVDEQGAREAARRLAEEASQGNYRGPLHGIPIGIKDLIDVQGMPTRAGSSLGEGCPAKADAPVVGRLRQAGAVILGKTVTTEFGGFDPSPTRNPWNLAHTPGGSSSGSAAAVATGMCVAAIGTQTGGSITRPASYCGVAGLKPSFDRIETNGIVPLTQHLDHVGPIAGGVADLLFMFQAMVGTDQSADEFAVGLRKSTPPRLGLVQSYFMEQADEPVREAVREALRCLTDAGASVIVASLPDSFNEVHTMHHRIMAVEASRMHHDRFKLHWSKYGKQLQALITEGLETTEEAYETALAHQRRFCKAMKGAFGEVDALVMPAIPTTAPAGLDSTGDPKFNSPWSYSGQPTVSIPCGPTANGLPAALQFVAADGDEIPLLSLAAWCEQVLQIDDLPPPLADPSNT